MILTKVGANLLSDLVIFSIIVNYSWRKFFCAIKKFISFIKFFVSAFIDIASTFFDSSFHSFSRSKCFTLFEVTLSFKFFSLSIKSVFFTKLEISFLLAKFAYANLAEKLSDVNSLNSWVVIYLSWSWSVVISFSMSLIFVF